MVCKVRWALTILLLGSTGCLSLLTERGATGGVEHARASFEVREASVTYTEARVSWGDGIQSADIEALAGSLGDRINRDFIEELDSRRQEMELLTLSVAEPAEFSTPVTITGSSLLEPSGLRVSMWRMPRLDTWSIVVRHAAEFHVFRDSVELQLISVMTLFDDEGRMVWQGAARSRKHHDDWYSGDHLATLSAKFVAETVRENVAEMVTATAVKELP